MVWEWMIYTAIFLIFIIIAWELLRDRMVAEGFTDGDQHIPEFFARYFPRRYDITPGQVQEGGGWVRNGRYFEGYVDVQRLGYKADFCRVIEKEGDPASRIVACALAGQEGLDSFTYRTDSARSGFKFSRDDYFRDVNGDGRDDYCRILKVAQAPKDAWETRCIPSGLIRFKQGNGDIVEIADNDPPTEIADLLWFFEGIMVWYRWYDDLLDYAENTILKSAGDVGIDETSKKEITKGLGLNRILAGGNAATQTADQFLKLGENSRLEFDSVVDLRQLRGISVWAHFDEFTNNARIFDFGNGAGKENVLLGIMARGNRSGQGFGAVGARPNPSNLVCQAKTPEEVSPYVYMKSTDANVDEWSCPATEPVDSMFSPDEMAEFEGLPPTANLLFEIWDASQRKMRIVIPDVVPMKRWVHIALTTTDMDPVRPVWQVWIDQKKVYENMDGFLPTKSYTTKNYMGRSNWETQSSQYQDRDERFRGALFDFRLYRIPMGEGKVKRTYEWGYAKLGLGKREE